MEFLVYQSRALVRPGSAEASNIVSASVRNNARVGLTGFLHHEPNLFVHYIEGPSEALADAWQRILSDPRHTEVSTIGRGRILPRLFGGWRMGCSDESIARFIDFLEEAAGKTCPSEATAREAIWFLRGVCQRQDLGLAS